ncbi:RagB/SusD family nutrient uptake outer membrane protein [Adhaeribacter arboris]|uniref:RagB/SusD family nutrient uptake outer membrane protein n=1 Tax=Adhaeribacter arboris TaxID=2072846 RepID=A0A2T2YCI0_9BACT|nr:RagB/SusD family nutrient uptake outer membrane protein [Adhaeribacter arboris]PSR53231.1 RagB/SusD family nutrient uptake outer membrane protein [Adhaeribacter arboris]
MKNIFYKTKCKVLISFSILALGGFYSCKEEFLDVDPQGKPEESEFFVNQEQAVMGVNSIYAHLRSWPVAAFAHLALTTIASDDAEKGSTPGDASFMNDFDNFTFTSTQFTLNDYWSGQYAGINLTNQVLTRVPAITMDESLKARLLAEAKFLRAFYYFNLVRAFGGVPLVTKIPETTEELNPTRASAEEVYALIISDLTDASAVLPVSYDAANVGRATKGAALGMLAKVKMYQKSWTEVLSLTEQVMALPYSLTSDYYQIFRFAGENNAESIFEVQAEVISGNCDASNSQWAEVQGARPTFGWGFSIPTTDLENAFEPGDVRKEATILYRGEVTPEGDKILETADNPRYNQKAYVPGSVAKECGYGHGQNIRILRLAEVLLMHAEAANELGQTDKALSSLNRVRERAGLDPVTTTDQAQLRNTIWHERRVELALENGDRFFDLVRQGRAAEVLRAQGKSFTPGKNEVYAIPQNQIELSGGKLTQNPGY